MEGYNLSTNLQLKNISWNMKKYNILLIRVYKITCTWNVLQDWPFIRKFWLYKGSIEYVDWYMYEGNLLRLCRQIQMSLQIIFYLAFFSSSDLLSNVLLFGSIVSYLLSEIGWLNENIDPYYVMTSIKKRKNKWTSDLAVK